MALINCPECNREVSDKAEVCPHCGFGVAKYVVRQNKIVKIQEEAGKEAYLYVKRKKKEEKEKAEREKREEEDRKNSIYHEAVSKYESEASIEVEKAEELFSVILGWKDSDIYLNKCKDRIAELRQREIIQEENFKKRKRKIISAVIILGICGGIAIGAYNFYEMVVVPRNIYESAMLNIQEGSYEEAIEKFNTIVGYKDATEQIEIALEGIYERNYSDAKKYFAEQKYVEALEILKQMENDEAVSELINMCENTLKYEEAVNLAENEKYREAIKILEDLDGFKDSTYILTQYRLEADYFDAVNCVDSGNQRNAVSLFENLGDYKDAKEKKNELCYQLGIEAFENRNYVIAKMYLEKITDDRDIVDILSECELQLSYINLYSMAHSSISAGKLYDALDYLKQLPSDYKGVSDEIELCNEFKNVVGEWKCVGYDGANNRWITEEDACRKQDFTVKIDNSGNLYLDNYKFDYSNLEYTGTVLSWTAVFSTHKLNIATGYLTYENNKELFIHTTE